MSKGKIDVVVGGQFGSEAKGHFTAQLVDSLRNTVPLLVARTGGPNAGHIVVDRHGTTWKLRQIPTPAVVHPDCPLVIAAGSEIDPDVLAQEVSELDTAGYRVSERLVIDQNATLIHQRHRDAEQDLTGRIGSTGKGIGAARAERIMRSASLACDLAADGWRVGDTAELMTAYLRLGNRVILEGTQGYGLGLHTDYYPFCTSSDCTAIDVLAQARISPWLAAEPPRVTVVMRTRPIRVAGNSGPLKGETNWEAIGRDPEHTTVTGKIRRVGTWDPELAVRAVLANGGPSTNVQVALMMWDHECPSAAGVRAYHDLSVPELVELSQWRLRIARQTGVRLVAVGTGPASMIWIPKGAQHTRLASIGTPETMDLV